MRTTIDIAEDVFFAAKDIARRDKKSLGQTISDMMRRGMGAFPSGQEALRPTSDVVDEELGRIYRKFGFTPFRSGPNVVTNDMVNAIRDEEGV